MIQMLDRSIECSRGGQSRRGGSSARRLWDSKQMYTASSFSAAELTQWLFLQDQEDSIEQFKIFREIVQLKAAVSKLLSLPSAGKFTYVVQNDQVIRPSAVGMTDGMEDAMIVNRRNQLLSKESQQYATNSGQVKVVHHEQRVQLERRSIAHQFPSAKDYNVVGGNEQRRLLQGRHRRLARLEVEVLRRVSHDGREGRVEIWP